MNVQFSANCWEECVYWHQTDKKIVKKINDLIKDCSRSPFQGIGKPGPLKHRYAGCWSRRITDEHRMIYKIEGETLILVQVRYHYE